MLQYQHIRSVSGVSILIAEQGHMVAARVYRACYCVAMGRGSAKEFWLDGMFNVRAKCYSM